MLVGCRGDQRWSGLCRKHEDQAVARGVVFMEEPVRVAVEREQGNPQLRAEFEAVAADRALMASWDRQARRRRASP